jgi:hypothetical protein
MISQVISVAAAYAIDVIVWSGSCELIEPLEASLGVRVSVGHTDLERGDRIRRTSNAAFSGRRSHTKTERGNKVVEGRREITGRT